MSLSSGKIHKTGKISMIIEHFNLVVSAYRRENSTLNTRELLRNSIKYLPKPFSNTMGDELEVLSRIDIQK